MLNDTGHSRDDEQDVPDHSDQDSPDNGGVTAEVCICDVGSEEGDNVAPWRERESADLMRIKIHHSRREMGRTELVESS